MDEKEFNEEIIRRIRETEQPGYDPGPPLNRRDKIVFAIVLAGSIVGLVLGYGA